VATIVNNGQVLVTWQIDTADLSRVEQVRVESLPASSVYVLSPLTSGSVVFGNLTPGAAYTFLVRTIGPTGLASAATVTAPVIISPPPASTIPPAPTLPPSVTPPGTPKPCVPTRWPGYATGFPNFLRSQVPQGVFLWFDGSAWNFRVFQPGPAVVFTGSIAANTRVSFSAARLEKGDLLVRGKTSARFSFRSANDLDGIKIVASCATRLTLQVSINGSPLSPQQIYIGPGSAAGSNPVAIVR
jgi:hypothetical protein